MATVALGTKEVGSIVKLNVGGTPREFIVVHQGLPGEMYDDSCDGVWLLMKDIYEKRQWHSSNLNDYENSTIHAYLNSEFIELFDVNVKQQIKMVKIPYRPGNGKSDTVNSGASGLSAKIFLLSVFEVGCVDIRGTAEDGAKLDYFILEDSSDAKSKRIAYNNGDAEKWWNRSPYLFTSNPLYINDGGTVGGVAYKSTDSLGIRPTLICPYSFRVSDNGSLLANTSPTIPSNVALSENVQGGTSLNITWGTSTDQDGDPVGYALERQIDSGEWVQIYRGEATSYTDAITRGWLTVAYRVRAYDSFELYSDYATSPTREVNNNRAPAIVCAPASGADLGVKTEGFSVSYSAADADGDPVTVTEAIDGVTLRTFTPEAEESCTFAVTGETFMKLLNGAHELAITASDGQAQAVHTLAFTKSVTAACVTLAQPMEADGPITLCVLSVTGSIPEGAAYSVKVTNNGKDAEPVWEDCTDEVKLGANHVFTNTTAANGFAFNFKVEVERGESGQGGYINSVQGGFQ